MYKRKDYCILVKLYAHHYQQNLLVIFLIISELTESSLRLL